MIKKVFGVTICFAALITQAGAQEFGIELNSGLQGMYYTLQNGQSKLLPGGSLSLNYTFSLSSQWGLLTGVTGGLYRAQATLPDGVVFTSDQVDDAGSAFQYNVKTTGYIETQRFIAASIPLQLQYHTAGPGTQWYFNGGGEVLFPFNASIYVSVQKLSLSGYYPDVNLEVSNLPQHGFGTLNGWKRSTSFKLKPAAALSAATGLSFGLSPGTRLYTGLYVEYGLTDLKDKNSSMPLVTYSSIGISRVQPNGVLNMQNAGQATLLSFGVQVRLSFGSTKAKPSIQHKTKTEPELQGMPTISDDEVDVIQRPVIFGIIGETSVPEIEKSHLNEIAEIMKQYPRIRISIVGHICNSSAETENIKVGAARAKAVAHYLRGKGIDRGRMDISFFGKSDPGDTTDPSANYQNRRVVITVERGD